MKKKIYNWLFKKAIKVIALNLVKYGNPLTPEYLLKRGWIEKDGFYFEPNVKERDQINIRFENHYYYVSHSNKHTYFATESSIEWFENYFLLAHGDNGRFELAGI